MKIHTNKNLSFIYKRNIFIYSLLGLCFLFFNFNKAYADVYINEIAWMGDSVSSTNEWLELYNDGTIDVDLEGWSIVSEDGSPNISINGAANSIIGSKKYYLIERTDDTTVPNVTADFVTAFGSGLSNSGEKIFLKKPDGTIVETLDFKTGWPAGDNTTKQTMQRISGSWVTALGTPRSINAGAVSENTSSTNLTPTVSDASKKETVPLKPKISVLSEKSTIVNVPTSFDATYVGSGGNVISSGYFVWSMGDGTVYNFNQQKKFTHTYQYPGDYTVNVAYFYNSWSDEPVIETSFILDVTNPKISLATIGTKGDLSISNNSDQDIKISKWKIIKGSKEYIFPYGMVILANKNIIISTKVTGFDESGNALLYYPDNSVYGGVDTTQTEVINNKTVVSRNISNNKIQNNTVQNINLNNNKLETENISNQLVASTAVLEPQTKTNTRWWVFVLVVFIVCGFGYLAMKLYRSKESALQEDFHLLDE